jgi:anti-sigma B factor antagonist
MVLDPVAAVPPRSIQEGSLMKNAPPTLSVCVNNSTVHLKIVGRAVFTSSVQFKTLVQELSARGYNKFSLDLRDCIVMDSTFLGVLAGAASRLKGAAESKHPSGIELINPNPRVTELLENLGVMHLFNVTAGSTPPAPPPEALSPDTAHTPSREEISRTCLEAHQTLMSLNPANIPKLKDVTAFLADDLKKLEARASPSSSST